MSPQRELGGAPVARALQAVFMSPHRELAGERFASALHVVFMSPQRELGGAQSLAPHPADSVGS